MLADFLIEIMCLISDPKPENSPYELRDANIPTGPSIAHSLPNHANILHHALWTKLEELKSKVDSTKPIDEESEFATLVLKAYRIWKNIQHDTLIQYIKFVAATLSNAPKYDFALLLNLLSILKKGFTTGERLFQFGATPAPPSEGHKNIQVSSNTSPSFFTSTEAERCFFSAVCIYGVCSFTFQSKPCKPFQK
jgi:hypothetical protein